MQNNQGEPHERTYSRIFRPGGAIIVTHLLHCFPVVDQCTGLAYMIRAMSKGCRGRFVWLVATHCSAPAS